jgi:uncharacterized protein (TIGR00299 family) protein
MRRTAFVDAPAGCSGDMFLGALVDAGLSIHALESVVAGLGIADLSVRASRTTRGPLAATKVDVLWRGDSADAPTMAHDHDHDHDHDHHHDHGHDHGHPHDHGHEHEPSSHGRAPHGRTLPDVVAILRGSSLDPAACDDAVRTFTLLAEAEGRVHGVSPDEVHFHEVGALDALVDVAGTCAGFRALGVTDVRVGPLPWFGGTVRTQHGVLPLPAPAVLHLLVGRPTFASGESYEQVTPTGAALVAALSRGPAIPAGFVPRLVGTGAGTHTGGRIPNVLRIVIGDVTADATPEQVTLLETNLDDASGQVVARAVERAMAEGALDAWAAPITMKKGRPGVVLSLLARSEDASRLEALLFRETPTLGVRRRGVERSVLARRHVDVETPWGRVRMKVRSGPDGDEATPEHDDCVRLADRANVPLRRVLDAAASAYAAAREVRPSENERSGS